MILEKEAGYDEFVAEKIRAAREQLAQGQFVSKEEFNQQMKNLLRQLEQEP